MKTWQADSGIRPHRLLARLLATAVAGLGRVPLIAGTIDFEASQVSTAVSGSSAAVYCYTYTLSGFDFHFGGSVVNEVEAVVDHPSLAGTFSVDSTWTGAGSPLHPGAAPVQTFRIDSYNNNPGNASCGDLISPITGTATPLAASAVPQPSTAFPAGAGLTGCGATLALKRRRSVTAC